MSTGSRRQRARDLCQQVGETPQLLQVLRGKKPCLWKQRFLRNFSDMTLAACPLGRFALG